MRRIAAGGPILEYERARQKIELLRAERASYARDLVAKHPIMVDLDEQIAQQQQLIDAFRKQSTEELKRRRDAATPPAAPVSAPKAAAAAAPATASKAARTFGGDIGKSGMRRPVALRMALAMAAIGGTIGTSPTPRAPNGWRGFGTSTSTVSIIGMSDATGTR